MTTGLNSRTPVVVTHDGVDVSPVLPNGDVAFGWLLRHQPFSTDYAVKWGGYAVRTLDVEPWDDATAGQHARSARGVFVHQHTDDDWFDAETEQIVRENCSACVLRGYGETREGGTLQPNHASWARLYVENRRPIPERYRAGFVAEMNSDNTAYAEALARSVAYFGVRFTD